MGVADKIELHRILKLIINEIWKLEHFDQHKLAKYMRCLFQAVLPHGDDLALEVLDNVLGVAKDSAEVCHSFHVFIP